MSHLWAIWNGAKGSPFQSALVGFPEGPVDLLPVYGGWLHTLLGVPLYRLGLPLEVAWTSALTLLFIGNGVGAFALARALGVGRLGAGAAAVLLQLDGWVLQNGTQGRPEHAGFGTLLLALAGLVATWRGEGPRWLPVATGVAGALTLVAGWEQGLWLFLATLWLLPWLLSSGASRAAVERLGLAAGTAAIVALPWALVFLDRATRVRALSEGADMMRDASHQSLILFRWFLDPGGTPTWLAVLALLVAPLLCRPRDRRLWGAALVGLGLSVIFALGPQPGLREVADLGIWGPQAWMQRLPVVGWFHSPARLAMGVSFASAVAGGLAVHWLAARHRGLAALLLLALLGDAALEAHIAKALPRGGFVVPERPEVTRVAELPGPGAVLDLPFDRLGVQAEENQLNQIIHGRPIPGHAWLAWLVRDQTPEMMDLAALFRWVNDGGDPTPPPLTGAERAELERIGLRFVALTPRGLPEGRRAQVIAGLRAELGEPVTGRAQRWMCWDLQDLPPR